MEIRGRLYVVGMGPGRHDLMTRQAEAALEKSDCLIGYKVYIDLIRADYPDKELLSSPMKKEKERCIRALELAGEGRTVSLVCSGDAGVYGMAGLVYELAPAYPEVEIEVVAGVTAALAGASLLGAPLTHDFSVISLSDLLTPWETIERRLRLSAEADLSIVLYNPSSRHRADYLQRACDILLEILSPAHVCGIATSIGREGEKSELLSLLELRDKGVDMFSTVFIGNRSTEVIGGKMVTKRGYRL